MEIWNITMSQSIHIHTNANFSKVNFTFTRWACLTDSHDLPLPWLPNLKHQLEKSSTYMICDLHMCYATLFQGHIKSILSVLSAYTISIKLSWQVQDHNCYVYFSTWSSNLGYPKIDWWQRNCILSLNSIVYADNPFTVLQVLTPFRVIFDMLNTIRSLKVKDQNFKIGKNYTFYFRYPNIPHQFSSTISCLLQQNTPATMFADANDHVV